MRGRLSVKAYVLALIPGLLLTRAAAAEDVKVDFSDPAVVEQFGESFVSSCTDGVHERLADAGISLTRDQDGQIATACRCSRDGVVGALAKRAPMTLSQLQDVLKDDPEIDQITTNCSNQNMPDFN
jgi:hypothetical protein